MPVHSPHIKTTGIYFITFTCNQWQPLIEITKSYDDFYKWFALLGEEGHAVTGFVIMPNHVHLLLYFNGGVKSLNTLIGNGKRFPAYSIVKKLNKMGETGLLAWMKQSVEQVDFIRGKRHEVWKDSFDVKHCRTENFIIQKLNYIHNNPCSGKWKLAPDTISYIHSSAAFYIGGKKPPCMITDYRDFILSNDENEF